MAAPPDRTKVRPAMPRNSASSRRSRCWGLAQSAQPRWPPTEAIRAARPNGAELRSFCFSPGECMSVFPGTWGHISRPGAGQGDRVNNPIEQLLADSFGQRRLLEGQVTIDGVIGDRRGLVITDYRRQGGDHNHRPVDVLL